MATQLASESQSTPSYSEKAPTSNPDHDPQLEEINETGHVQELERNFSLLSVCSVGIVTGNTWAALGGSIVVAIYNGGPPGVLYEFIAVSIFYWLVAASIAELASSMPSSAGVYHWASITPGPKYGPICGWFAGWWNTFAWMMGSASMASICGQIAVAMYGIYHPDYSPQRWHVFIGYLIITWMCCSVVLFANRALPMINTIGLFFILAGVFITIMVCATMPHVTGSEYASSSFVWADWSNQTGYASNGFVFLAGMLNGAYSVGTPDCVSHLAEEIPHPKRNIPLAIGAQMIIGFLTAFFYMIAIFYSISSIDDILAAPYFPLATIYAQATQSNAGTMGLLFIIFVPVFCCCVGTYITAGRCLWTIARDGAVPFSGTFGHVSRRFKNPFNATLFCGCFSTVLGAIYVGSSTAFNAFVGSFVVLSTISYLASILPFMLTGRFSQSSKSTGNANGMRPGWFQMGHLTGHVINGISCVYIIVFVVIYCFPYSMPVTAANMNYACLITGTITLVAGFWWLVKGRRGYIGPKAMVHVDEPHISSGGVVGESTDSEKLS
ncbi:choline transporter [Mollisia scopiformis]|uniref:Choline transporter n=1 Tax=Mollisia scopiformis TaxID=149040 RepID=A0A194X8J6_MOLSC|nr:choline transporter [Mollisia scopiformis]KUJ16491.1 choline transporter [Mollisia scopiformis]